ncbi:MAG: hypothetical protein ACOY3P_07755 [Planctomycetota bacterium]
MAEQPLPREEAKSAAWAEKPSAIPPTKTASRAASKPPAKPSTKPSTKAEAKPPEKPGAAKPETNGQKAKPASKPNRVSQDLLDDLAEASLNEGTPLEPVVPPPPWLSKMLQQTPGWLVSMVFHMAMMIILALWMLPSAEGRVENRLISALPHEDNLEELEELLDQPLQELSVADEMVTSTEAIEPETMITPTDDLEAAAIEVELSDFGIDKAPRNDLMATLGAFSGTGLSGRGEGSRRAMIRQYGGTEESERAVAAALKWFANHQMPDGGWSLDLTEVPSCRGQCRNSGDRARARIAATALAILPFLGAGQTHKQGQYQSTVKNGIYFMVSNMRKDGGLNDPGGRMYAHGLATIALCEAYAMTSDKGLKDPAQAALNFICWAQDDIGGGWRYEPKMPGDTSVVGWQIMALKSGHMAYLRVPPATIKKAFDFLDLVQSNSGANYGYTDPGRGEATSAIGLLCRMYLGWKKDNPALQRGVKWLSELGPSTQSSGNNRNNFYYNYYATQVMRHWEGEEWEKWNSVMRDHLVNSQATQGHEAGSWWAQSQGSHANDAGGRLYTTAMATMILEVYYRHMPIYRSQSVEEDFPL